MDNRPFTRTTAQLAATLLFSVLGLVMVSSLQHDIHPAAIAAAAIQNVLP